MSNVLERDIEPRVASDAHVGRHLARPMLALCARAGVKCNLKGRVLSYDIHQHLCKCVPVSPLPLNGFMRGDPPSPLIKDGGGGGTVGQTWRWHLHQKRRRGNGELPGLVSPQQTGRDLRPEPQMASGASGGSGSSRLRRQQD